MHKKMKHRSTTFKKFRTLLFSCLICLSCNSQKNVKPIVSITGKEISAKELTSKIDSIISITDIPGLSIAIINNNEVVYNRVFGVTNTETGMPVNSKTIFEGASLSKPIFAYFVMKMVEQKVIDLDKPLYKYLEHPNISKDSEEAYKLITARMVLSHRTGFPNHANGKKIELAFKPGTDFMYSGEAFQYLAKVISKLKGLNLETDFNSLFHSEVIEQLNMPHSTFVWNAYLSKHKANGHDGNNQPTENNPGNGNWNGQTFSAYSSLHSESSEYANFLIALLNQTGIERNSFIDMFSEHTKFKDSNPLKQQIGQTGWGLGMAQKKTEYGTMHMHTGNNHDFQSYMMILPEKEFGIVFFTNSGKAIPLAQGLNSIIGPIF